MHHGELLRAVTKDDLLVYHMQRDWTRAALDQQEKAMLRFVVKLNDEPAKVEEKDTQLLRDVGFDDKGVLDIVLVTSMFNFMNRLADGVELKPDEKFVRDRQRGEARVEAELNHHQRPAAEPAAENRHEGSQFP